MTHHTSHTTNPPHTTAYLATGPRITVEHIHDLPTNCQNIVHTKKDRTVQDHTPNKETESPPQEDKRTTLRLLQFRQSFH